ncbi:MAG: MarR family transcriptional regulator [Anaerolineae bacterium]|nr:MarR family transcriptional regulator [Anaerolineae bacterium]
MRAGNIGRLLLQAHRAFGLRAHHKLQARGHGDLGMAHTSLIAHLDLEGTRITTLAERAGMTKQSMGELVIELERKGYVERSSDPTDKRATLVRFTQAGCRFLEDAYHVKQEIEAEYTALLGADGLESLRAMLEAITESESSNE